MNEKIRDQIVTILCTGKVNMFDEKAVRQLAGDMGLDELATFIKKKPTEYIQFLLNGYLAEEQQHE